MTRPTDEITDSDYEVATSSSLSGLQDQLQYFDSSIWRLVNVIYDNTFIAFLERRKK